MTSRRALYASAGAIALYWAIYAAKHLLGPHNPPSSVAALALNVCVRSAIVAGIVWILLRASGESVRDLGFTRDGTGRFLLRSGLAAMAMFVITNVVLNNVFAALLGSSGAPPISALFRDPHDAPYWIFAAIVGGGFAEELERAFILTRFEKLFGRTGLVAAVILDSFVFGLGHLYQGNPSAVSSGFTGLMFALIFLRRRRVIDAMVVHALFDLMGIAAAYAIYAHGT
jgi:membrane protease YdiL (CAAX protease family)